MDDSNDPPFIRLISSVVFGVFLRFFFSDSGLSEWFNSRNEIITPVNAWNRVEEGLSLLKTNMSPYSSGLFHETPIMLQVFLLADYLLSKKVYILFVITDILCGVTLFKLSTKLGHYLDNKQDRTVFHRDSKNLHISKDWLQTLPFHVTAIHFINPFVISACLAKSTSTFSNLLVLLTMFHSLKGNKFLSILFLALSTYQVLYMVVLIVPLSLYMAKTKNTNASLISYEALQVYASTLVMFILFMLGLFYVSYLIAGSLDFVYSTYWFILTVPDLKPNIGLFWYFFAEMFEHFRVFFLYVFQINVFIYTVPMTCKLADDPMFLMFCQMMIVGIFKSYPSYSDTGLYLTLLPVWWHLFSYMRNSLLVFCMILSSTVLAPILWHLWIYSGSANANFYFAVTLCFATAQIFLLTDLIYAYLRREFNISTGLKPKLANGKPALVMLE